VAALLALTAVAACDPVPLVNNTFATACDEIDAAAYAAGKARASHFEGRVDAAAGWLSTAGGASRRRCFPTSGGLTTGLTDRHCIQRNELFVRLEDGDGVRHYAVPAMATHKLYARDGRAICEIVEEAE
jgi:hypothetical protein